GWVTRIESLRKVSPTSRPCQRLRPALGNFPTLLPRPPLCPEPPLRRCLLPWPILNLRLSRLPRLEQPPPLEWPRPVFHDTNGHGFPAVLISGATGHVYLGNMDGEGRTRTRSACRAQVEVSVTL